MPRPYLALLCLLAATVPATARAGEITVPLGDQTEHLPLPAGYCTLDRSRPGDEGLFQFQQRALGGVNRLLAIGVDCSQLIAVHGGERNDFDRYVLFSTQAPGGTPLSIRDETRAAFIAEGAASIPALDTKAIADDVKRRGGAMGVPLSMQKFGVLGRDGNGFYIGGLLKAANRDTAFVAAVTLAGNHPISAAFYRGGAGDRDLATVYDEAQAEAVALIAANSVGAAAMIAPAGAPDLSGATPPHAGNPITTFLSRFDLLEAAVVGLICGVVGLAVTGLRGRR